MSTIPLTLIEGAIAMPRLRPLDRLPAPFGRDWAFLPPGQSWRTELKALYAAVLRTFCMSDKAIFSFGRWAPLNARRAAAAASGSAVASGSAAASSASAGAAASAAATPTPTRATVFHPAREEGPHRFAEASAAQVVEGPLFVSMSRGTSSYWKAIAGGACALSGAAMLAWIAVNHQTHRRTIDAVQPVDTAIANRDAQPAQRRAPEAVIARGPDGGGEIKARTRSAVSARAANASPSAPAAYAPASAATKAAAAPRVASSNTDSRRHTLRETAGIRRETTSRRLMRSTAANPLSLVAPMAGDTRHITVPPIAQRTSPVASAAGTYSPLAPARLGIDEYADVTLSAATHLREIAPPPRPATSNHSSASNGTEWMNHMSQRRVTEVPDQFAK
jgi:hypothetical protein